MQERCEAARRATISSAAGFDKGRSGMARSAAEGTKSSHTNSIFGMG